MNRVIASALSCVALACAPRSPPALAAARIHVASPEELAAAGIDTTPPEKLSEVPLPRLPRGGTARVRCIITAAGAVTECRVEKSLAPEIDQALIDALQQRRYRPAMRDGLPVETPYVFNLTFAE